MEKGGSGCKVSERETKKQRQRGIKFIGNQWRDQPVYKEQANDIHCHWHCQCAYCKHGRLDTKFDHSGNKEAATDLIVRLWFKKPEENIVFYLQQKKKKAFDHSTSEL